MPMNPRLLRPTASGFDPRRIEGLSIWMDALSPSSYTESSGQITEWRSRVGSLKFEQTTANNRPTLFESSSDVQGATAAVINGKQAFYFDGTNDVLLGSAQVTGTQWAAFGVVRSDDVAAVRGVFTRDNNANITFVTRGPQFLRHNAAGNVETVAFSASDVLTSSAGNMASGVAAVLHSVQAASTVQSFLNNAGGTAISCTQNGSANSVAIGVTRAPSSSFWKGTIGEILLYNRALTTAEQSRVYQYLRSKWGIA